MRDVAGLSLWIIFDHPADYPRHWAVRRQIAQAGGVWHDPRVWLAESLEEARKWLPPGLYPLGRQAGDDPVIAEVWV